MKSISIYVDESGNSGANYLDKAQPFFVLGGWVIPKAAKSKIESQVVEWETSLGSQASEVKGANLVRRIRGRKAILELIRILGSNRVFTTYTIMEKRLGVCAKFVESVFDSEYNPSIPANFFLQKDIRYNLADAIYDAVDDDLIFDFGKAIQQKDSSELDKQFERLKSLALGLGIEEFERYIPGCPKERAIAFLVSGDNISSAINSTMLLSLVSNIELFARTYGLGSWSLYHDNIQSFSGSFEDLMLKMENGWATYLQREFSAPIPVGQYAIQEFDFLKSHESPLIRAADCLSSLIRFYLERINDDAIFEDPIDRRGVLLTLGPILRHKIPGSFPSLYHEVLSSKCASKIADRFG